MPYRARAAAASLAMAIATVLGVMPGAAPAPVAAGAQKVVIIVGPVGSQTGSYRSKGDSIAATAQAAGATVVKVYSPNATWANVKAAVLKVVVPSGRVAPFLYLLFTLNDACPVKVELATQAPAGELIQPPPVTFASLGLATTT